MHEGIRDSPLRIGIGGIAIESSTFSPHRTTLGDFNVVEGPELLARYDFTGPDDPLSQGVKWVPLRYARALPGGPVVPEAYDELAAGLLERLREAGRLDGLLLDIHGAMSVVGRTDIEGQLARQVRELVGPHTLVSASMDLHGNVSRDLAAATDLLTAYRMAPHEDAWLTRRRAAANLVDCLRRGKRPRKAWIQIPVLLPGEKTSTRQEPATSLYGSLSEVEQLDGVLDAALWVGYAWGDEARSCAAAVVTGFDEQVLTEQARLLAERYWAARRAFSFVAPTGSADACIDEALASPHRPFLISDSGDNPTAGGANDTTHVLARLLARPALADGHQSAILASVWDAAAVAACQRAGVGEEVRCQVGGRVDTDHDGPLPIRGTVSCLREDPAGGLQAAVRIGGVNVIITERRRPFHRLHSFTDLGLDLAAVDLTVVKIGYLEPELYAAAREWRLALTPGGVDQDLARLDYRAVRRPIFPLDPDMPDPVLRAEII